MLSNFYNYYMGGQQELTTPEKQKENEAINPLEESQALSFKSFSENKN